MAFIYFRFKEVPAVKSVLHGASAAAVALTIAMVIQTGRKCLTSLVPVLVGAGLLRAQRHSAVASSGRACRSWRRSA